MSNPGTIPDDHRVYMEIKDDRGRAESLFDGTFYALCEMVKEFKKGDSLHDITDDKHMVFVNKEIGWVRFTPKNNETTQAKRIRELEDRVTKLEDFPVL